MFHVSTACFKKTEEGVLRHDCTLVEATRSSCGCWRRQGGPFKVNMLSWLILALHGVYTRWFQARCLSDRLTSNYSCIV